MDYQSHNLTVPRGSILFNPFVSGTFAGRGYKQLGNCPEFNLTRDVTPLEHRSSQQGYRTRDKRLIIGDDLGGTVITDDLKAENMRLWFMSPSVTTVTTASATGATETVANVQKGSIYQLGRSAVAPTGLRNLTVTSVGAGATNFVANADYLVDAANGLLTVLAGGSIAEDSTLTVTYNVAASTHQQVIADNKEVEGELLFISNNPHGEQSRLWIPRATLTPNGDLSMMTDPDSPTWQQIPLTITALKLGSMALAYRDNYPVA